MASWLGKIVDRLRLRPLDDPQARATTTRAHPPRRVRHEGFLVDIAAHATAPEPTSDSARVDRLDVRTSPLRLTLVNASPRTGQALDLAHGLLGILARASACCDALATRPTQASLRLAQTLRLANLEALASSCPDYMRGRQDWASSVLMVELVAPGRLAAASVGGCRLWRWRRGQLQELLRPQVRPVRKLVTVAQTSFFRAPDLERASEPAAVASILERGLGVSERLGLPECGSWMMRPGDRYLLGSTLFAEFGSLDRRRLPDARIAELLAAQPERDACAAALLAEVAAVSHRSASVAVIDVSSEEDA